ncbi:MAG: hypothetical protein EHM77_01215 [Planctomycetaceae bacterium]|nr:MAG: hypothetical protein EHM77_01215 [Planctomycetaceae bacterium]
MTNQRLKTRSAGGVALFEDPIRGGIELVESGMNWPLKHTPRADLRFAAQQLQFRTATTGNEVRFAGVRCPTGCNLDHVDKTHA